MINDFKSLALLSWYQGKNRMLGAFREKPITFIVLTLMALGFYIGVLLPAWWLLRFVYNQDVYGVLLASKLIQILLYMAAGVALMSSMTTAIAHFYLSKDLELQFSLPVRFHVWFAWRFGQVFLQSNWMLLVFASPVICMYLHLCGSPVTVQLLGVLTLAVVSSFPVLAAVLLCLILVKVFPARRIQQVFLVLSVLLVSLVVFLFRYLEPERFIGPGGLERFRGFVDLVEPGAQPWNPARWAYNIIVSMGNARWSTALPEALKLASLFVFSLALLLFLSMRLYRASWDRALQSLSGEGDQAPGDRRERFLSRLLGHPFWHQEAREVLLFLRDPSQWSQVFVMVALLGLYLFSLTKIPDNPFGGTLYALGLGNGAFVAFISLSVASRFIFTAFSTDGQAFWIMKTSPTGNYGYVRGKLVVFGLPTLVFSQVLCLGSGMILDLPGAQLMLLSLHTLWDVSLIILLALAMGMLFISPNVENPVKLIISPGGVLLMALGLFFTTLHVGIRLCMHSALVNTLVMERVHLNFQGPYAPWVVAVLIGAEAMLALVLLRRGVRHLERGEFAVG